MAILANNLFALHPSPCIMWDDEVLWAGQCPMSFVHAQFNEQAAKYQQAAYIPIPAGYGLQGLGGAVTQAGQAFAVQQVQELQQAQMMYNALRTQRAEQIGQIGQIGQLGQLGQLQGAPQNWLENIGGALGGLWRQRG